MKKDPIKNLMTGQKLYQQRARKVFPILVQYARNQKKMYYFELAKKVGMPNSRNLNYVLGCIGRALKELEKKTEHQNTAYSMYCYK